MHVVCAGRVVRALIPPPLTHYPLNFFCAPSAIQSGRKQVLSSNRQGNSDSVSSLLNSYIQEDPDCDGIRRDSLQAITSTVNYDRHAGFTYEDDFSQNELNLIQQIDKKLVLLALEFRRLKSASSNQSRERLVKCDDFAKSLLRAPVTLRSLPKMHGT